MTTTDPTPAPRPTPAHAAGDGEYDTTDQVTGSPDDTAGRAYEAGVADAEPAGAASAGPTAGDGPVLLPVDPPEDTRYAGFDDTRAEDRIDDRPADDSFDGVVDGSADRPADSAADSALDDTVDDRTGDRLDDRLGDGVDDRTDDVLPGEDRPTDHDVADHDVADHDVADHDVADHDVADHDVVVAGADSGTSGVSSSSISGGDQDWHELQSKFVDDPAAAVRDAGALVEQALSDLRGRLEAGDTESLRTAFKRYRDLFSTLT